MSQPRREGWLRRLGHWLRARFRTRRTAVEPEPRRATLDRPTIETLPARRRPRRAAAPKAVDKKPVAAARVLAPAADIDIEAPPPIDHVEIRDLGEPPRPAEGAKSVFVQVEDITIHAVERPARGVSATTAPTVILVHGAGVDHRDWTFSFLQRLSLDWRVLVFDRPGFGQSERPRGAASALPTTQARLLRSAAAALGVKRAVLVGHSWGGAVVMAWALDAPEMVAGVASLSGAVMPWSLSTAIANGRRIQESARLAFGAGGMRAAAVAALEESFAPDTPPPGYIKHMKTDLTPLSGPAAATMADISTINGALSLMSRRYDEISVRIELVYGECDRILPISEQTHVLKMLTNAGLTALPGVGHMTHHSAPAPCLAAIKRLMNTIE